MTQSDQLPNPVHWREWLIVYQAELTARLEAGSKAYGGASFTQTSPQLVSEIQQELLDVSGWAFILWCRLQTLKETLRGQGL